MKKSDLKTGYIVKLRNATLGIVIDGTDINNSGFSIWDLKGKLMIIESFYMYCKNLFSVVFQV